jgi:hypothetical protein
MAAGLYNMVCEQGATFQRSFRWVDADEQPILLTGWSARMQVRTSYKAAEPLVSLDSDALGGIVLTPAEGGIYLELDAAATAELPAKQGVYDLEMVSPTGEVTRLLQGTFTITPEATR